MLGEWLCVYIQYINSVWSVYSTKFVEEEKKTVQIFIYYFKYIHYRYIILLRVITKRFLPILLDIFCELHYFFIEMIIVFPHIILYLV